MPMSWLQLHQKTDFQGQIGEQGLLHSKSTQESLPGFQMGRGDNRCEIILRSAQKKTICALGERLTLFRLMKDLYLDQLALGGGKGAKILRRVKRRADARSVQ